MGFDKDLLIRLRKKDQSALQAAIHHYSPYVAAVVRKSLGPQGSSQDVEELISDAFVALWQNAAKLRDDSDLKYWLAVVARNAAFRRRESLPSELPLEENLIFDEPSPQESLDQKERSRLVRGIVDSMEPIDREVFLRHYYWHQPIAQIAREMSKNQSAIKSRLARGREKLRKILCKEDCLL